jgi:HipA-like protein
MKENFLTTLRHLFQSEEQEPDVVTPTHSSVSFRLVFKHIIIGHLMLENGLWKFAYSEEFKVQDDLSPIIDFPDVHQTYTSRELFPFFAFRIPSLKRPQIQEIIRHDRIDRHNAADLLKRFGKKTIVNPFELEIG